MNRLVIAFLVVCAPVLGEIKAVVFDCGGVMVEEAYLPLDDYLVRKLHVDSTTLMHNEGPRCLMPLQKGMVTEEIFWASIAQKYGHPLPVDFEARFKQQLGQSYVKRQSMYTLVARLQRNGYQTPMLSNTTAWAAEVLDKADFYAPFEPVILSHKTGHAKPEPPIYQLLLHKLRLPAHQVVFIDDEEPNVVAARKLGIHALLFTSEEQLKEDLKTLGVNV